MEPASLIAAVLVVAVVGGGLFWQRAHRERQTARLADAKADAQRWHERLGGQVLQLTANDDEAVRQALADAGERYNAAGGQLESATTPRQCELASQTALEGLHHVRAARLGLGLDPGPGPDLPLTEAQRQNGLVRAEREVTVEGQHLKASPQYARDTPYYYPGGRVQGRQAPAGYYSHPWWKTALASGAGMLGAMMLFDALFVPDLGGSAAGSGDGAESGAGDAGDAGGDVEFGDMGGFDF